MGSIAQHSPPVTWKTTQV